MQRFIAHTRYTFCKFNAGWLSQDFPESEKRVLKKLLNSVSRQPFSEKKIVVAAARVVFTFSYLTDIKCWRVIVVDVVGVIIVVVVGVVGVVIVVVGSGSSGKPVEPGKPGNALLLQTVGLPINLKRFNFLAKNHFR